ncbi:MAG TPA: M20 family metallopeptidase [Candidatus Sulfotelmatobacter sp.]|nr:M20 family metallopeptidase [Candidatus Sulfotelmatobacter sp.]
MDAHTEIARAIDSYRDKVVALSHEIHEHPELRFQEHFAAGLLSKAATELGLEVEREVGGLKTAFRAEFGAKGPAVAILAEYDALPNGHSCGHNLIAGAALSAVAGLKSIAGKLPGRVVFLGTPAEEGGGGKIILIDQGAVRGVDAAMMAHPTDSEYCTMPALATQHLKLTFHGHGAHAALAPWDGSSALAAVIQTFQSVDAMRLHLRDGSRIHGIITDGGQAVNIVPERAECLFLARGKSSKYAKEMGARVIRCAEGAAMATGTRLEHIVEGGYKNLINNLSMAHRYAAHTEALGTKSVEAPENTPTGSTDMGDVSHVMPAIHPSFAISRRGEGNCHEDAFVAHADSQRGYDAMIRVAKAMAMTAYDLLAEPELLAAAKKEFEARKES